jgi:hypothetical protein
MKKTPAPARSRRFLHFVSTRCQRRGLVSSHNEPTTSDQAELYQASRIKRSRSTQAEVRGRRDALLEIIEAMRPMTVRQVFYQATVRGLVEKAETGYAKMQTDLTLLRRAGELPYDWLADNTRWQRKPRSFDGVEEALQETARLYRKNLWANANAYVEIWLEKDALSGVILPVTADYDVPLMVARGYASCHSCIAPRKTADQDQRHAVKGI